MALLETDLMSPAPYSIKILYSTSYSSTYLIRENDGAEFPHVYVKIYYEGPERTPIVLILSDSGTGLNVNNETRNTSQTDNTLVTEKSSSSWNIASFLSSTLNPQHAAPYIVLTTHCHYDHICGIRSLQDAKVDVSVLSSSHDVGFLTPWSNLQIHSLCQRLGRKAPKYNATWIDDVQRITYRDGASQPRVQSSLTVIHTPGHTPDSISWYDHDAYVVCVGDMFYEKESDETRSGSGGQWRREPPVSVIFVEDSNIIDWNASMHRLLDFVRQENRKLDTDLVELQYPYKQDGLGQAVAYEELFTSDGDWTEITKVPKGRRVALCASHVTVGIDAEFALLDMLAFMLRIQLDQVPKADMGAGTWIWDDTLSSDHVVDHSGDLPRNSQYSVIAPWSVIHPET